MARPQNSINNNLQMHVAGFLICRDNVGGNFGPATL
jgi:hypothetical protein